jgi:hypothetical protein
MALTTVSELRSVLGVGTLYPDATLQSVCDAADAVLLPMLWQNQQYNSFQSNTTTEGTLYFDTRVENIYFVGQSVSISGNGAPHDGTKVITSIGIDYIAYDVTGSPTEKDRHAVSPIGTVSYLPVSYVGDEAIQNASLMVAVEIWQARTATLSGSNAIDFQPSPYRVSAQLLAKVRGLTAHALSPSSMIG